MPDNNCKKYSDIVDRVFNATKTSLCVSSGVAEEHDLIFIHCTGCGWFDKCYTVKELEFFVGFNTPGVCLYLCIACCQHVYQLVGKEAVQDQRVNCLFNDPTYWGVIDHHSAQKLKVAFRKAGKCGTFLWEVQSALPFNSVQRVFMVAVTHVKYSTTSGYLSRITDSIDSCTYYIVYREGRYQITRRVRGSVRFLPPYGVPSFPTLSEAIDRAKGRRVAIDCGQEQGRLYCRCSQINRSTVLDENENVQNRVWRLQDLSAFFVRNYSFHFQKECEQLVPFGLRNIIRDIRSCDLFRDC